MRRWIMHVDMDAFFASIEQLDHPEYKGHPVIVGGLSSRGVVATCSYEARKFGVHSAMPISRAKKLCPDGIYVYPRMDRYKEVSHQIFSIMKEFTPHIEPLSIDEAFLEVSGMSTMYSGPKALGRAIKDRVFEETGLIISAGLAPNKFLANETCQRGIFHCFVYVRGFRGRCGGHGVRREVRRDARMALLGGGGSALRALRLRGALFPRTHAARIPERPGYGILQCRR